VFITCISVVHEDPDILLKETCHYFVEPFTRALPEGGEPAAQGEVDANNVLFCFHKLNFPSLTLLPMVQQGQFLLIVRFCRGSVFAELQFLLSENFYEGHLPERTVSLSNRFLT